MILSSSTKFTSESRQFNIFVIFLPTFDGKICFWNQPYNLPVIMGQKYVFGNFMNFSLPVNTGKFMYKQQLVTIYQSTRTENTIAKSRNSRFTGKFWFWIQSLNLPVNYENSNFWSFFCPNCMVNYVII